MKAAVVHASTAARPSRTCRSPSPGPEQVLVRIEACGPMPHRHPRRARRMAGQADAAVHPRPRGRRHRRARRAGQHPRRAAGDRVALPWLGYACGDCRYCNSGRETLCHRQLNTGYGINGGFAEYAVGYARHVVRVPDGIDPLDAAPLTCAGVTTYKAVKVSGARSSDLVAVFGAGGLGHLAVQYARITGASVVAVDVNAERLATARELGAEHVIHAGEQDPVAAMQRAGRRRRRHLDRRHARRRSSRRSARWPAADASSASACPRRTACASRSSRRCWAASRSKGSIVGTHHDLEEVFALHRRGLTRVRRPSARSTTSTRRSSRSSTAAPAPRLVFRVSGEAGDTAGATRAAAGA